MLWIRLYIKFAVDNGHLLSMNTLQVICRKLHDSIYSIAETTKANNMSILNIYWKKYHSTWKIQTCASVKICYRGQQVFLKSAESQRKNKTAKRRSKFSQGTRYLPLTSYGLNIEKFCNQESPIPLTKSAKK